MTDDDARQQLEADVSRETFDRLILYHEMLIHWQKTINLVSANTLREAWKRHFFDSQQLWDLGSKQAQKWLDLGSGGGFPGLVIAVLAAETSSKLRVTLVESDLRKCAFMREVARRTGIQADIISRRIEDIPAQTADVISARALKPLSKLIELSIPHMAKTATLLFPKGKTYAAELASLDRNWKNKFEIIPSRTDPDAVILRSSWSEAESAG